jgi:hypothetical protein
MLGKDNSRANALSRQYNLARLKTINKLVILRINKDRLLGLS